MSQTANESEAEIQRDDEETDNVIEETNQTPNAAKAYLKRQGQQK